MDARNDDTPALERVLTAQRGGPDEPQGGEDYRRLNICVVFTSAGRTLAALATAGRLADKLGARITVLALQVVPFPLPLDHPPLSHEWNEARFRFLASQSPVETVVRLYFCRDKIETLKGALCPNSMIVIGGRRSRWPFTAEKRLARVLRRAGHEVILAEAE